MKVFVYFNLHKGCWSLKALEGPNKGRVVAHRAFLTLKDCTFKVSEAGRQRVLRERRKNVHAGVVGEWDDSPMPMCAGFFPVSYNPYRYGYFFDRLNHEPVNKAFLVRMVAHKNGHAIEALS